MKKQCIALMVNDSFIEGAVTLLYSLRKHNPWLEADLVLFHSRNWLPLSEASREIIRAVYPNPRFVEISEDLFDKINFAPAEENFNALAEGRRNCGKIMYVKFHVFGLSDYDRVVYFDSDVVCTGDVRPLFESDWDLAVCQRGVVWDDTWQNVFADRDHCFNAGVLSIGARYLGDPMMPGLLEAAEEGHWMGDQGALYRYFEGKQVRYIDSRYNANGDHFAEWHTGPVKKFADASILHLTHKKPWEKTDEEKDVCDRLWDQYRVECDDELRTRHGLSFPPRETSAAPPVAATSADRAKYARAARHAVRPVFPDLEDAGVKKIGWAAGGTFDLISRLYPLELAYLVDGNPALWGTTINGVEVRSPDSIADEDPDRCLVVIYAGRAAPIRDQLACYGHFRSVVARRLLDFPSLASHAASPAELAMRAVEKSLAMSILSLGPTTRFAIRGAGDFGRLALELCRARGREPVVILDDVAAGGYLDGIPILGVADGMKDGSIAKIVSPKFLRRNAIGKLPKSKVGQPGSYPLSGSP